MNIERGLIRVYYVLWALWAAFTLLVAVLEGFDQLSSGRMVNAPNPTFGWHFVLLVWPLLGIVLPWVLLTAIRWNVRRFSK